MMSEVVRYCESLGIRVIPEFDNPGHARAIGTDPFFENITLCFQDDMHSSVPDAYTVVGGPPTGVLDPSNDKTYDLIRGVITDLNNTFPDNFIHLGGDEVRVSCFNHSTTMLQFKTDNNLTTDSEVVAWHMNKTRSIIKEINQNKVAAYWSDDYSLDQIYEDGNLIVYWGKAGNISKMIETYPNQQYVLATGDYYYMDCGFGNKYGNKAWCDPFKTFWTIYQLEPSDYLNDTLKMWGSEIATFSELNGDENIHIKTWPRGAAMADKIWGPLVDTDLIKIVERQVMFANYLNNRGIPTSPVTGRYCEAFADHCFEKVITPGSKSNNVNIAT
jgi:hexosaminidase